jgi:hypothetical protein
MKSAPSSIIALMAAVLVAFAWTTEAGADGAVNIDSCQTLSTPNTTYRLTADISNVADCLIVAADRITIDLQGHSLISPIATDGIGITDRDQPHDLIVIKNGTISGYGGGILLRNSTRVSVIAVTANNNLGDGIFIGGKQALVKSSTASSNGFQGIVAVGDRAQVQQSTATKNRFAGITAGANCLVTMNTASDNVDLSIGILVGDKCTVSYNTANGNANAGITAGFRSLVTHNTAVNNRGGLSDFAVRCPSDVTFNTSTNGFPTSYFLDGTGCKTVGNE